MTDYTPSEARVCIDYCNAAIKRSRPDGSFMKMEEADAAFTRFLAEKRAEWEAERGGQVEYRVFNSEGEWWASADSLEAARHYLIDEPGRIERAVWLPVEADPS